jgi:hypothetical protein
MRRCAILLVAATLAACGSTPRAPAEPENPVVTACRAEARGTAGALDFGREQNVANANHMDQLRQRRADAEARAMNDCLRARGLLRGGGVERVRPPTGLF